jgi:hypothetical protein
MEKSSQVAWKVVPFRHFFPLKVVPLIEVLLYRDTGKVSGGGDAFEFCLQGWKFTAVGPSLDPPAFWGITSRSVKGGNKLGELVQPAWPEGF